MLSDPQSIKFGSDAAISLPRTSSGVNSGAFTSPDGVAKVEVVHQYGKRSRRRGRTEHSKIAVDPLTATNQKVGMSVYTVIDVPPVGYTIAQAKDIVDAHNVWFAAQVQRILGGEA